MYFRFHFFLRNADLIIGCWLAIFFKILKSSQLIVCQIADQSDYKRQIRTIQLANVLIGESL